MSDEPTPTLKVVRGAPTADELAALVAVVAAHARTADSPPAPARSAWGTYWNSHRPPLQPGAGAWRASALPR